MRDSRMAGWARHYAGMSNGDRSVRSPPLPVRCSASTVCLPPEVERLLVDVVADGFIVYCCGPKAAPRALVASYQLKHYVDLLTIRCFDHVTTARIRTPERGRVDVFDPKAVVWAYEGPPQSALRALLDLPHPQHPHAPASTYPAPPSLHIPRAEQRPMTIQFPPPGRARRRATRLTTAMTALGELKVSSSAPPPPAVAHRPCKWPGDTS